MIGAKLLQRIDNFEWMLASYGCILAGAIVLILEPGESWPHAVILILGGGALEAVRRYTNRRTRSENRNDGSAEHAVESDNPETQ